MPLTIPVRLIELTLQQGFIPELKVFVGAKMVSPGYITDKSIEFNNLCNLVGYQRRTVLKHLNQLVRLKWVGYDHKTKRYYIRSWAWFRSQELIIERVSVTIRESDMFTFREFAAGVIIGFKLRKQEYYFRKLAEEKDPYLNKRKIKRKPRRGKASKSVTLSGRVTLQDNDAFQASSRQIPSCTGFSNAHIAELLHCRETNACNLKHAAEKAGYLKTRPRLKIIQVLPGGPDYAIRKHYYKAFGDDARKLRFSTELVNGTKTLCLVQQLHDEIIPLIPFKRIKYLKMLYKKQFNQRKSQNY